MRSLVSANPVPIAVRSTQNLMAILPGSAAFMSLLKLPGEGIHMLLRRNSEPE